MRTKGKPLYNLLKRTLTSFNLPTGYGKLLIYQALPLNFDCMLAATGHVVISPLVSLMKDRVERLTNLGIPAVTLSDMQTV